MQRDGRQRNATGSKNWILRDLGKDPWDSGGKGRQRQIKASVVPAPAAGGAAAL